MPSGLTHHPSLRRELDRLELTRRKLQAGLLPADRPSIRRGQSLEFADYRAYVPGDDPRHIDWRAYGRSGRLYVKQFEAEEDTDVHLILDASDSMDWGAPTKLEVAREILAGVGYVACASGDRTQVVAAPGGATGPPLRGRTAAAAVDRRLDAVGPSGPADLGSLLTGLVGQLRPGVLVLASDLYDEGWEAGVSAALNRGHEVTLLHVLSEAELAPELAGDLALQDVETGETVDVTVDEEVLADYRAALGAWRDSAAQWCARRGVRWVPVRTGRSVRDALMVDLRRAGLLRPAG